MITKEFAQHFAEEWVASWNAHDLPRVLSHYTEDFEMTSPYIVTVADEPTGTLKGKDKVEAYWSTALKKFTDLHFDLIDVLYSMNSVTIYYHSASKNSKVLEFFLFDSSGKVQKAIAHYA
ncbi:MAG: nuclear transport factor 2 family protein [Bacteroidetes bacterium]|nr:nuclear transport factor 2 family protein [Bacteroidota bacterium]